MSTSNFLPARDDQLFGPGAWSKTYILSGVSVLSASNWHAYVVANRGDVQSTGSLVTPTVSVSIPANSVTFTLTPTQVATLVGAGAAKFPGFWSVYSDTLERPVVAGSFVVDRTATNSGVDDTPTTLTVTSTTSYLSVLAPSVAPTVLDTWNAARDASATTVADIVCLTDSIGVLGSVTSKPWGWLLAKSLSAFDTRAEGAGWVFAKADGAAVIQLDSCAGTASTTGAGGYASDLTVGQTAAHTATCDGVSVVYTKQPGGGGIEVRDGGPGGTLITTISTAAATTQPSQVTTVNLTTYASRQVHLTATGNVHLEGCYFHAGDQTTGTRVWIPGHSGYKTSDFVTNSTLAMNLVASLDPALVIIATGYNDTSATAYEADLRTLIAMVQAQTGNNVAIMSPWAGVAGPAVGLAKAQAAERVAGELGLAFIDLYGMLGSVDNAIDPWDLSADGAHPRVGASQMMADLVLSKVAVDPTLVAISVPERGPRDYLGGITNDQGTKGTATVGANLGYPIISLSEAAGDAVPSVAAFNAKLAALIGLAGSAVGWGAGGAADLDTYLYRAAAGALKSNGTLTGTALAASGLTGATAATRYGGGTAVGAPTTGTFSTGDFVVDQTGRLWVCTASGSPGTWVDVATTGLGIYGGGSDGVGNITGGTTTLTRDMFYSSLTVTGTGMLNTAGFRVFVQGVCTINASGIISNDGVAGGAGGGAGAAASANTVGGGGTGATGTVGAGTAGGSQGNSLGGSGGAGGLGSGGAGGAGGTATAPIAANGSIRTSAFTTTGQLVGAAVTRLLGGGGGGTGGGDGGQGPGSGGGGGVVLLCARTIVNNGTIRALGGAGGSAGGTNRGGAGGGGGGVVLLTYNAYSGSGTTSVAGGAGGAKTGTGVAGTAGSAGTVITVQN